MKARPDILQPFRPALEAARHYSLLKLRHDLLAGLTVSVVEVPQAMAYALIAGVPAQYGLYTSIIQGVIGALLSSSEHLATGPTNTQSLLIAATVTRAMALMGAGKNVDPNMYLQLVFALTLFKGLIQLAFSAARLGMLIRYVSRSVIMGLAAGAGMLILAGQTPHFLGLIRPENPSRLPGVLGYMVDLWAGLGGVNLHAVLVGVVALAIILGMRAWSPLLPGSLLAVVLTALGTWALGWDAYLPRLGELPQGWPTFQWPKLGLAQMELLWSGALALALLGMIESVAIVKAIAARTGERISANQEFFAQGFKNMVSSFFQCIPGSGSFTRSALDYAAGAQTRFAAVYNALFVAVIYGVFAPLAGHIPLASLAAVLFVIAAGLIDWQYLARVVRTSRADTLVWLTTLLATLLAPLQYAVFIGVFLNIALYLRRASHLHVAEMVDNPAGPFLERPLHDPQGRKDLLFLQVEGDLFFGVADELQDRLTAIASSGIRVAILRLKRTHSIDVTALYVLEEFVRKMQAQGGQVLFCGVKPEIGLVLSRFGLTALVGADHVFEAGVGVYTSAKKAIAKARQLLQHSIDVSTLPDLDEEENWAFEI